jgi:two-component system chemotaxis response regulator CheB
MIGVLIVDDSSVARQVLRGHLTGVSGIEVLDAAMDPLFALTRMKKRWPDVIVLDVEMPRMDGLAFLRKLMAEHPTPVIICSSLTEQGTTTCLEALASGAVAVFSKAALGIGLVDGPVAGGAELVRAVRGAAGAKVQRVTTAVAVPKLSVDAVLPLDVLGQRSLSATSEQVVALGTSTGGTQALEAVLTRLPRTAPGIVVVQHMPPKFTTAFAARLDGLCEVDVLEAKGGERVLPGRVLLAPGGRHLVLKRSGAEYHVDVIDAPAVNRHCPSVDVLFRSVARTAGRNATAIIMTGMGDDGARGLLELREVGARTYAQDEQSCVVFGMPREAIKLGAAEHVVALAEIPRVILSGHTPRSA